MGEIKLNRLVQQALTGKLGSVRLQDTLAFDHPFNIAAQSRRGRRPIDSVDAVMPTGSPDRTPPGAYDAGCTAPRALRFPYDLRMAPIWHPLHYRAAFEASRHSVFARSTNADFPARGAGASVQINRPKRPDPGCQAGFST